MINFPNAPATGDLFYSTSNGITYRWNGTLWLTEPGLGTGFGPTGDFCAFQSGGLPAGVSNTWVILNPTGIISGNAGSWYVPGTGVYKPPPGRYFIQGHMSGTWTGGALGMYADLRKNAVEIAWHQGTTAAASYATNIVVEATVDANGTDVFDFRGYCAGAAGTFSNVTFLAFPIAGAKGPPGDQGPPPTAGGGLIKDVLLASPATQIDVSNLNVKSCMIMFKLGVVSGTGQLVNFQNTVNGTPDATNGYYQLQMYQSGTTVSGAQSAVSTQQTITSVDVNYWLTGHIIVPDMKSTSGQKTCQFNMVSGGVWYNQAIGYFTSGLNVNVNGYRFYGAVNLCAGSFVRVVGWP